MIDLPFLRKFPEKAWVRKWVKITIWKDPKFSHFQLTSKSGYPLIYGRLSAFSYGFDSAKKSWILGLRRCRPRICFFCCKSYPLKRCFELRPAHVFHHSRKHKNNGFPDHHHAVGVTCVIPKKKLFRNEIPYFPPNVHDTIRSSWKCWLIPLYIKRTTPHRPTCFCNILLLVFCTLPF